jgi:hypothetical protein
LACCQATLAFTASKLLQHPERIYGLLLLELHLFRWFVLVGVVLVVGNQAKAVLVVGALWLGKTTLLLCPATLIRLLLVTVEQEATPKEMMAAILLLKV